MDSSVYAYLTGAGMAAIGWALRTIYQKLVEQDKQLSKLEVGHAKLEVTLLGVNGMNGINGTVKMLDVKMDDLTKRLEQAGA